MKKDETKVFGFRKDIGTPDQIVQKALNKVLDRGLVLYGDPVENWKAIASRWDVDPIEAPIMRAEEKIVRAKNTYQTDMLTFEDSIVDAIGQLLIAAMGHRSVNGAGE